MDLTEDALQAKIENQLFEDFIIFFGTNVRLNFLLHGFVLGICGTQQMRGGDNYIGFYYESLFVCPLA